MTINPATLPGGGRVDAPIEHRAHPGAEHRLGCPMCQSWEHVVIDVPSTTHHRIEAYRIDAVTAPEYDVIETTLPNEHDKIESVTKVRCVKCRWSYTGEDPLARLVVVDE